MRRNITPAAVFAGHLAGFTVLALILGVIVGLVVFALHPWLLILLPIALLAGWRNQRYPDRRRTAAEERKRIYGF
ncbi:hypothetical protein [Modestobacter lapidis]